MSRADELKGNTFGSAWLDYLLIGGGLSLIATAGVLTHPAGSGIVSVETLPYVILLSVAAHFAASTVRLYTKPGTYRSLPFLTMAFPLVSLIVLTLCMFQAGRLGPHLQSLYLTWSPYHYAAQAYGLAVMYSYRSGCALGATNKKLLWWVSMLPFFHNFLTADGVGLDWLLPGSAMATPIVQQLRSGVHGLLLALAFVAPVALFVKIWRDNGRPLPLISLLTVVANGIWFFVLAPLDAFVYATVFHGIQYMAITVIFHVKDQMAREGNRRGRWYHALWFYAASLLLGYGLFNCLPLAYVAVGFGEVESVLLVVAAINIHHFIVDGYIWRLKKSDGNRRIVESGVLEPARA